ncbi:MAG: tyrosine--tRNA ligase [Candidatus Colwellbacteria bacterium]|nr:tyrosine--tRNA ligase [Candidatus Colwellbacteria bacterium]
MASSTKSSGESKKDLVERLLTRGVESVVDFGELQKLLLSSKSLRVKHGIDPTGPKIHLGRAVALRKLKTFQELGHRIVLIVGDFTAKIGDPSDKLEKRPMLTAAQIKQNLQTYRKQLGKVVDLSKAEFYFNSQWLKKLNFQEIAELAESFSVQQMLVRRNFKERYTRGEEISLRELLYPLMQGYDSVAVKADVEVGGSDQLFNLIAGRVIQKHYGQKEQSILTTKMLDGTDGRKMSTSWGNVINIADEPNDMFGKVMSINDELISQYALLCTSIPEETIAENDRKIKAGEINPRDVKFMLATEIVALYYGQKQAQRAGEQFIRVFTTKALPEKIETQLLNNKNYEINKLLVETNMASSRSEAQRLVIQGGVKLDGKKVSNSEQRVKISAKPILLQVGKRRFLKIRVKRLH